MNKTLLRTLDFLMALLGLLVTFPILLLVLIIGYFDTGAPIFIQQRVGKNKKPFDLIKFRKNILLANITNQHSIKYC